MSDVWYCLDSGMGRGGWNMALDVVLAQTAEDNPFLRFYRWSPFCLSLGYGQKYEEFDEERCRQEGIEVVRRPTGGRAILHADEVTYSVTLSNRNSLFDLSIMGLYRYISAGLAGGLEELGIPVIVEKKGLNREQVGSSKAPLCFSSVGRYELKVSGKKIVGSAQRRFPTNLLQHGSILLGDYHLLQEELLVDSLSPKWSSLRKVTTSVSTELGRKVEYEEAVKAIREGFEKALHIRLEPYELTEKQKALAEDLVKDYTILTFEQTNPELCMDNNNRINPPLLRGESKGGSC